MVRSMLGLDAPKVEDVGWHRANQGIACILSRVEVVARPVEPDKRATADR